MRGGNSDAFGAGDCENLASPRVGADKDWLGFAAAVSAGSSDIEEQGVERPDV